MQCLRDTDDNLNDSITVAVLQAIGVGKDGFDLCEHLDSRFDRTYVNWGHPEANTSMWKTSWEGALDPEAPVKYYCPGGWRRFSIRVPKELTDKLPPKFWDESRQLYHGLNPENVGCILRDGFKPSMCQHQGRAVYLTPSLRYAAHPRYGRVQVYKGKYYQVILQCRVLDSLLTDFKDALKRRGPDADVYESGAPPNVETMGAAGRPMDENIRNYFMEVILFSERMMKPEDGVVITGIMVRCLDTNPMDLPENKWWFYWNGREFLENPRNGLVVNRDPASSSRR